MKYVHLVGDPLKKQLELATLELGPLLGSHDSGDAAHDGEPAESPNTR
jgi:hypothetical protein